METAAAALAASCPFAVSQRLPNLPHAAFQPCVIAAVVVLFPSRRRRTGAVLLVRSR